MISTNTTLASNQTNMIFSPILFNLNFTGSQLNNVLKTYTGDLSGCLANCSNQGVCYVSNQQQYSCQCNQYKTGFSCQSDTRPCSSGPCINNGTCSNINNETSFLCTCQNGLYYGIHCENKINLCLNSTICIQNQGYCQMNGTQPICKCFMDYSGTNCETMSTSLIVKKTIISGTTIISIVIMVCLSIVILCFDYTKFSLMKKPIKKKPVIKKFKYKKHKNFPSHKY